MYVNGLGFRAIERVTGVNHNTVIRWVRASAEVLPDAPLASEIPEITEIDELLAELHAAQSLCPLGQTYIGKKK